MLNTLYRLISVPHIDPQAPPALREAYALTTIVAIAAALFFSPLLTYLGDPFGASVLAVFGVPEGEGDDAERQPEREELEMIAKMIENQRAELQTLQARVFDLEDELARGRERVEELDEQLAEMLTASP